MVEDPKIVNLKDALDRGLGDGAFVQMILEDFHHTLPDFLNRFNKAIANNALVQLSRDARQLKGAANNLAAGHIAAAALFLEQTARQGNLLEARDALDGIKTAIDEFEHHISRINWAEI